MKIGSGVQHIKVGDRVTVCAPDHYRDADIHWMLSYGASQTNNGAFAEYLRLDSYVAMKLPDGMTYEEAASFPVRSLFSLASVVLNF